MKSIKILFIFLFLTSAACSQNSTISGSLLGISGLTNGPVLPFMSGPNILPLTVNGSTCDAGTSQGYLNKPCVSITICSTNNGNCQVINDVLVDTGSYGLRIFNSSLNSNLNLSTVTSGGQTVTDCFQYGGGTADWGPVKMAQVQLGTETPVTMPVQAIESTFADPTVCSVGQFTLDSSPSEAGFTAIMGVGLFAADCGDYCANNTDNGGYFTCSGSSCNGLAYPVALQVTNPVALLPTDNNGVIVELPSVPLGGVTSANGYLVLGIGTESNNLPGHVTDYSTTATDEFGEFTTTFNGNQDIGYIDSGSNSFQFDAVASTPDCTDPNFGGLYCPASVVNLSAIDTAASGNASTEVLFQIGNVEGFNPNFSVFVEFGADDGGQGNFDWGLPFFLGRNVFVGLDGTSSPLGSGPYWAF